ncbi:MAG: TVP38/TMEM64 family protein [Deltaproteobacteria bacterium]|nr:TVP38/TMEM64 family protein [Deltaproteobacteria bacterium]
MAIAYASGLTELDVPEVRRRIEALGALGVVGFVIAFPIAVLLNVPGLAMVVAGALTFGEIPGFFASLLGGVLATSTGFVIARSFGGRALHEIERPFVRKALAAMERRPVRTVVLLRSVFWFGSPLTFALALSDLRFRDYFIGSFLGLLVPVTGGTVLARLVTVAFE